jgi:hypothetical protein
MRTLAPIAAAALLLACDGVARVDVQPPSVRFFGRGQSLKVHATPLTKRGKPAPDQVCRWSSSDERVATARGPHNEATVTSVGPGAATVRCEVGGAAGEVPVTVRIVAKVTVAERKVELRMLDEPQPFAPRIEARDDTGAPVAGRAVLTRCANEEICRGDGRGQLWAVGPGDTTALAEVEGAQSETLAVHVVDARTARTRPQRVTGNPMLEIEKLVRERDAREAREKAKAAAGR